MQTFNLLITTSETTLYQGIVLSAIFPGAQGQFEILIHHAPIITMIKAGTVKIIDANNQKIEIPVQPGFFEFYQNSGVLLAAPVIEDKY